MKITEQTRFGKIASCIRTKTPNLLIYAFLKLTIIITLLYSTGGIIYSAIKYGVLEIEQQKSILIFVEHIFFYLLPLFIVLGFYSFYEKIIKKDLTGVEENPSSENALDILNNTKILFLSSVLSFTLIKVIDKLFFEDHSPKTIDIISYGVFLILLMSYILLYHKIVEKD